jgi:hypothetical protein
MFNVLSLVCDIYIAKKRRTSVRLYMPNLIPVICPFPKAVFGIVVPGTQVQVGRCAVAGIGAIVVRLAAFLKGHKLVYQYLLVICI